MPRQRTHYRRRVYVFPADFHERLVRFKEESGLSWAEIARRLGTYPYTVRRWLAGMRPDTQHMMALLELANSLGLRHLLTGPPQRRIGLRPVSATAAVSNWRPSTSPTRTTLQEQPF